MRKKQAFAYGRFFGQMALSVLVLAALGLAAGPKADPAQAVFGFSPSTPSSTAQADRIAPVGEEELTAEAEVAVGPQWQVTAEELEDLSNLEYLKSHFYIVDSRTALLPGDVDAQDFLALLPYPFPGKICRQCRGIRRGMGRRRISEGAAGTAIWHFRTPSSRAVRYCGWSKPDFGGI